jgi:hypothetical protein
VDLIDFQMRSIAAELLDPEYLTMARIALVLLASEHPDELARYEIATWAGGILYGLCQANKVFNNSVWSRLDVDGREIAEAADVSQRTLAKRGKAVRAVLGLDQWPPPEPFVHSHVSERLARFRRWIVKNPPPLDGR